MVDGFAREAASSRRSQRHRVPDGLLQEASLSHLARAATENRSRATARWIAGHVRPERRYRPLAGTGPRRKALPRVRKSLASRYYQLLTGHAVTGSFPLFLFLFPLFSYLPFHLVRGGAVDWGAGERGAPV